MIKQVTEGYELSTRRQDYQTLCRRCPENDRCLLLSSPPAVCHWLLSLPLQPHRMMPRHWFTQSTNWLWHAVTVGQIRLTRISTFTLHQRMRLITARCTVLTATVCQSRAAKFDSAESKSIANNLTRSVAVAKKADRTYYALLIAYIYIYIY